MIVLPCSFTDLLSSASLLSHTLNTVVFTLQDLQALYPRCMPMQSYYLYTAPNKFIFISWLMAWPIFPCVTAVYKRRHTLWCSSELHFLVHVITAWLLLRKQMQSRGLKKRRRKKNWSNPRGFWFYSGDVTGYSWERQKAEPKKRRNI